MQAAQIIPFDFESREVRTLLIDDQPWFAAKDIISALGYAKSSSPTKLTAHVPDQWKGVNPIHTPGGTQRLMMLSEQGVYFFLGRSDKEKALPFQMWLAGEVLPAIRKHGRYEDRNDQLTTLLGQTIGTDGFRCLGAVLDGKVRSLPKPIRTKVKNHIWSQVHKAFSVVSAQDIPANSMDAARNFIAAYAIEGEWIAAAKDDARRNALTSEQLADIRHLLNASRGVKQLWDGGIGRLVAAANWNVYSNTYGHIEALDDIGRALSKSLGISISTDKVCSTSVVSRNADKRRDELIDYAKHFKSSCTLVEHGSFEPVRKGKLHEKIAAQKHRLLALAKSVSPTDQGYDAYLLSELKSLQELESRNKSHYLVGMGLWHMALRRYIEPVVPM